MGKLEGKVAVVTGASSGIGEATVLALVAEGAKVVASARRADRLENLKHKIHKPEPAAVGAGAPNDLNPEILKAIDSAASWGEIHTVIGDVRNEADCDRLIQETMDKYGRIDILVNNAGVMLLGPIVGADTEDWRRMIDTNLYGLIYCTHKAITHMRKQQSGHIVNISSVAGRTARSGAGVYNLTKWGVNGFSESLRQEVHGDHIRVTIIEPGAVATELREHITVPQVKKDMDAWAEAMEQLEAEDIAASILYAVTQHPRVNVNEILIRPTDQAG
ncbi:MAG TPA: SDR family NAD(P)-dependent oxidoreductase [Fimbriimonadaceae bacterium]|jgi:NADP-dependent 3-hydroxy acid dehydrogenase YdfG